MNRDRVRHSYLDRPAPLAFAHHGGAADGLENTAAAFRRADEAGSALAPLVDLIRRTGAWDRVCVGSFNENRVARAQRLAGPRLATSFGTAGVLGLWMRARSLSAAVRRSAVCAQVPEVQSGIRVVDHRFVRTAHALGLQVHVWTVNGPGRMAALLDLGVDGIMTDHIETLRTVLTGRGAWA